MKKVFAIVMLGLAFASCRKDWKCDCTVGDVTTTSTIENKTLKDATDQCNNSGSVLGVDYKCNVNVFK